MKLKNWIDRKQKFVSEIFRTMESLGTILALLQALRKYFSYFHFVVVIVNISYPIRSHDVCLSYSLCDENAWKCYVKYFRGVNTNAMLQMDHFSMFKRKKYSHQHTNIWPVSHIKTDVYEIHTINIVARKVKGINFFEKSIIMRSRQHHYAYRFSWALPKNKNLLKKVFYMNECVLRFKHCHLDA